MKSKYIDLTQTLNADTTVYPGTPRPQLNQLYSVGKDGFSEMAIILTSHTGTHIDAPCHVLAGAKTLDQFSLDKFIGKAIVIPCKGLSEIDVDFLEQYKDKLTQVDFILLYTGWQEKWNTKAYFDDCPRLTHKASQWLLQFDLKGVGLDALSVDPISDSEEINPHTLPNHFIFLEQEIILIENLTNLDLLPDSVFDFQCFPLKIEMADGSPVRAMASIIRS